MSGVSNRQAVCGLLAGTVMMTGISHAQPIGAAPDYQALLDERRYEQSWAPLLEEASSAAADGEGGALPLSGPAPEDNAASGLTFHAHQTAATLPQGYAQFLKEAEAAQTCQLVRAVADQFDTRAAMAAVGNGASFAFGQADHCSPNTLRFSASGADDNQDVGFTLAPEITHCVDGGCTVRGFKGEIRVGELITDQAKGQAGWYMYAAADGTRVTWDRQTAQGLSDIAQSVDVADSMTMGDLEAGLMINRGPADLSLNYVRRRSKFQTWEDKIVDNEDYVGVKLSVD
ncbi:hypothetical protein [Parvularcula bermudensis]|nr:hypothetical protein [Parvularcula bermudensis]